MGMCFNFMYRGKTCISTKKASVLFVWEGKKLNKNFKSSLGFIHGAHVGYYSKIQQELLQLISSAGECSNVVDVNRKSVDVSTSEDMNTIRACDAIVFPARFFDVTAAIVSPHDFNTVKNAGNKAVLNQHQGPQSVKHQEDFPTYPTSCLDLYI